MAKFYPYPVTVRCQVCGRLTDEACLLLLSHKPLDARPRVHERMIICGECGHLIKKVATKESDPVDRTRRWEKRLHKKKP